MLQWLKQKILKHKNKNSNFICANCIWYGAEDDFNKPYKKNLRYCGNHKKYVSQYDKCDNFKEELFEATENSTATPELDLNLEMRADLE